MGTRRPRKGRLGSPTSHVPHVAGEHQQRAARRRPFGEEEDTCKMGSLIKGHQTVGEMAGALEEGRATSWNSRQRFHVVGG